MTILLRTYPLYTESALTHYLGIGFTCLGQDQMFHTAPTILISHSLLCLKLLTPWCRVVPVTLHHIRVIFYPFLPCVPATTLSSITPSLPFIIFNHDTTSPPFSFLCIGVVEPVYSKFTENGSVSTSGHTTEGSTSSSLASPRLTNFQVSQQDSSYLQTHPAMSSNII